VNITGLAAARMSGGSEFHAAGPLVQHVNITGLAAARMSGGNQTRTDDVIEIRQASTSVYSVHDRALFEVSEFHAAGPACEHNRAGCSTNVRWQ